MQADFLNPSENDVVNAQQIEIRIRVIPDDGFTITGGTISVNGSTPLALTFDATLQAWKKLVSIPHGPVTARAVITDSSPSSQTFAVNFSNSPSTVTPPLVNVTNPIENQVLRKPGVTVRADVTRTARVARVEVSYNKGKTWIRMSIPKGAGGT